MMMMIPSNELGSVYITGPTKSSTRLALIFSLPELRDNSFFQSFPISNGSDSPILKKFKQTKFRLTISSLWRIVAFHRYLRGDQLNSL